MSAVFSSAQDVFSWFELIGYDPLPIILIKSGDVIERTFEYNITQKENLLVHAGAFFYAAAYPSGVGGLQIVNQLVKIKVL